LTLSRRSHTLMRMKTTSIRLLTTLPCSAETAYHAWMDSETHAAMIEGTADIDPVVSGHFRIWNGEVQGENLVLDEDIHRVVQHWRYNYDDWPEDQPSRLMVTFGAVNDKETEMQLEQTDIPEKYAGDIKKGWEEYYFKPMQRYFSVNSDTNTL
jgi:activator of HSP90 ATPase